MEMAVLHENNGLQVLRKHSLDAMAFIPQQDLQTFLFYFEQLKRLHEVPGDIIEFGVHRGTIFSFLVKVSELLDHPISSRHKIGFDTFSGFPQDMHMAESAVHTDREHARAFTDTSYEFVLKKLEGRDLSRIKLIQGDIYKMLPQFLQIWPHRIAMAICDVDEGDLTRFILEHIWPRMSPGGRIYLDEYSRGGWSETIGVCEFLQELEIPPRVIRCGYRPAAFIEVPVSLWNGYRIIPEIQVMPGHQCPDSNLKQTKASYPAPK